MKYFLDTEFIEAPGHLDLISIGIVAEDGRKFYLENSEVDWGRASPWVIANVRPHVVSANNRTLMGEVAVPKSEMGDRIQAFVGVDPSQFWGYYCDYDWVALCWLFGTMMDLPKGFPFLCRDLRQALDERGLQHVKQPDDAPHHALSDAQWIAETYAAHVSHPKGLKDET